MSSQLCCSLRPKLSASVVSQHHALLEFHPGTSEHVCERNLRLMGPLATRARKLGSLLGAWRAYALASLAVQKQEAPDIAVCWVEVLGGWSWEAGTLLLYLPWGSACQPCLSPCVMESFKTMQVLSGWRFFHSLSRDPELSSGPCAPTIVCRNLSTLFYQMPTYLLTLLPDGLPCN